MSQKVIVTRQQFYQWNEEATQLNNTSVLGILLRNGIKVFKDNNAKEVSRMNKGILEMQAKYLEMGPDGKPQFEGEGAERQVKLKPGIAIADFNAASIAFMGEKITITI